MKKEPRFALESDLCAAFLAWVAACHPSVKVYAEWAGWDILLVYPDGWQLGIQAKLRLNAEVILQAAPNRWYEGVTGPDYRAVLVPERNGWSQVASNLGLVVFWPMRQAFRRDGRSFDFSPELGGRYVIGGENFVDWNPTTRHELPPVATDAIAGSPCPVSLTPWKLGALAVLAELEVQGTITAKRIRALGIDPRRWTQCRWLEPAEKRGDWTRGEKCPPFDRQHATAFEAAQEKARQRTPVEASG